MAPPSDPKPYLGAPSKPYRAELQGGPYDGQVAHIATTANALWMATYATGVGLKQHRYVRGALLGPKRWLYRYDGEQLPPQ